MEKGYRQPKGMRLSPCVKMQGLQPVENPKLAAIARKQRYAGLREMCCGTRVRGAVPQPQSSSLALPCQILVSVDGCQSLAAFGSCIHWMRAPSRRPITPAGTVGKWVPGGHNRHRRLATRRCDTKRAGTTAVVPATIEWQQCLLHLRFFDTPQPLSPFYSSSENFSGYDSTAYSSFLPFSFSTRSTASIWVSLV